MGAQGRPVTGWQPAPFATQATLEEDTAALGNVESELLALNLEKEKVWTMLIDDSHLVRWN